MFMNFLLAGSIGDQINTIFHGLDMAVFHFFGTMQSDFLTAIARIFTAMGSTRYIALMAVMGLVMCFFKRTRKVGFALVFAVIIGTLITNVIVKPTVLRIRPYNTLQSDARYWAWYLGAGKLCESDFSFPSGHTTGAFEVAAALFLCHFSEKRRGVAWIFPAVAVLTGASRIYLMVHYPTDVFAGVIVGVIAGLLGYLISKGLTGLIRRRKLNDLLDLGRLFKKRIGKGTGALMIAASWLLIFAFSYFTSIHEGGDETVRCAYHREYDCQNEAQVDSKKYPAINGEYYCKIHWKQLNEQFEQTGSVEGDSDAEDRFRSSSEPVVNTDFFSFFNDPEILAFRNSFVSNPPVKMKYSRGEAEIVVTDAALIRQVFEALQGVQVGEETESVPDSGTGESIYYTFYMANENAYTLGVEYPGIILYNGKYYSVTNDNGAFQIIPDDYWEGIGQSTEDAA